MLTDADPLHSAAGRRAHSTTPTTAVMPLLVEVAERAATDELIVEVDAPADAGGVAGRRAGGARRPGREQCASCAPASSRCSPGPATAARCAADIDLEHVAWLWVGFTLSCGFRHALEPEKAVEDSPFVARTFVQMLSPDHNAEEAA